MNEIKDLIAEFLPELHAFSLDELYAFKAHWMQVLEERKMPEWVLSCCNVIIQVIIDDKLEA